MPMIEVPFVVGDKVWLLEHYETKAGRWAQRVVGPRMIIEVQITAYGVWGVVRFKRPGECWYRMRAIPSRRIYPTKEAAREAREIANKEERERWLKARKQEEAEVD